MVDNILSNREGYGYTVNTNIGYGPIFEDNNDKQFAVDILLVNKFNESSNIKYYGKHYYREKNDFKLPCTIHGDPVSQNGKISNIHIDRQNIIDTLT